MKRLMLALALVGGFMVAGSPVMATTEHCPEHEGHSGKVETPQDPTEEEQAATNDFVADEGTLICVKAGPEASGYIEADGITSMLGYVTWTVGQNENTPDVS